MYKKEGEKEGVKRREPYRVGLALPPLSLTIQCNTEHSITTHTTLHHTTLRYARHHVAIFEVGFSFTVRAFNLAVSPWSLHRRYTHSQPHVRTDAHTHIPNIHRTQQQHIHTHTFAAGGERRCDRYIP